MRDFTLFYEKFSQGVKSQYGYSEVYINPTYADKKEMMGNDRFASFRGIIDPKGDLFVWVDKAAIHEEVLAELGLSHNYEAIPLYIYPDDEYNVIISYWTRSTASEEDKSKYYDRATNNQHLKTFLDQPISIKKVDPKTGDVVNFMETYIREKAVGKKKIGQEAKETIVFVEPTDKEIQYLLQVDRRGIRGGVDANGTVYVWKLDIDPKTIHAEFKYNFIAEFRWTPDKREEAEVKLLDPQWLLDKMSEELLKRIDYGMVNAFPFLKFYNITDYLGKTIKQRDL